MNHWAKIIGAVETHGTCALVTITKAQGSTPREEGAWMIVTTWVSRLHRWWHVRVACDGRGASNVE